ncbi:hypothetical protein ACFE04_000539 [Oxalis oulophora]
MVAFGKKLKERQIEECIAPLMEWTDTHYRTLARFITKHAWLYTEMLAAETIVYQENNLDRFLEFTPEQHLIVLQIGGNNLENIAKATQLANHYGYDEINFNCGCPSAKVAGHGCFGVRLMLDPKIEYLSIMLLIVRPSWCAAECCSRVALCLCPMADSSLTPESLTTPCSNLSVS